MAGALFQVFHLHVAIAGHDLVQDLLHVQHLRQAAGVLVVVQARDAGDEGTTAAGFGREDLAPFEAHDLVHRLHRKGLGAARVFGDQQDVEAVLGTQPTTAGRSITEMIWPRMLTMPSIGDCVPAALVTGGMGTISRILKTLMPNSSERSPWDPPQAEQQQLELVGCGEIGSFVNLFLKIVHAPSRCE
jgi:hypothetical protein